MAESPQDLSSGALLDKESYNEDDSKSEEPSSPPSTPQSLPSGSNRPPPPLIPFSPKSSSAGKVALHYLTTAKLALECKYEDKLAQRDIATSFKSPVCK